MAPKEIEEMLLREGSKVSPDKYDETTESVDARQRRTELLIPLLAACREVWTSHSQEDLELMAEKLGDGSRDGESLSKSANRSKFGEVDPWICPSRRRAIPVD